MQILPPANPYAIHNDHDYFVPSPADHFLAECGLVSMSELKVQCVEIDTHVDKKL